jgi:signal transduction histidine kinase
MFGEKGWRRPVSPIDRMSTLRRTRYADGIGGMRFKTWPVAAVGLTGLLVLVVFSVVTASHRAQEIFTELDELNRHHHDVETKLRALRADVHLSGIFVRDYLLDTSRERAPEYRSQLAEFRERNRTTVRELMDIARHAGEDEARIRGLGENLEDYWEGFEPLFDWTIQEKITNSARFIRREVIPRREAVMTLAAEIEALNNQNLATQRAEVTRRHQAFSDELFTLLGRSVFFGLLLAVLVVIRLRVLERRSEQQTRHAQEAEAQMRLLSQQLVAAQEEERKKLSRELHDHVGQMLTALRMEIGRLDRVRPSSDPRISAALAECRQLIDDMVHIVRDLALGLRPSMLDDFGLQPALEWLARDVTRRSNVPVELQVVGPLDRLDEQHRTCTYRVIQEALTNCVRHARASSITVSVRADGGRLDVSVRDDGIGVDPQRRATGFGLRSIEERVRELGGTVSLSTGVGPGTTLNIQLPVAVEPALARAAG